MLINACLQLDYMNEKLALTGECLEWHDHYYPVKG